MNQPGWLLAAALAGVGCANPGPAPPPPATACVNPVRLTAESARARLALPRAARGIVLEVVRVENPHLDPVRIDIFLPGAAGPHASITLYPPNQPARSFLPRLPRQVGEVEVRLVPERRRPLRGAVDVRLVAR